MRAVNPRAKGVATPGTFRHPKYTPPLDRLPLRRRIALRLRGIAAKLELSTGELGRRDRSILLHAQNRLDRRRAAQGIPTIGLRGVQR